MNKEIFNNIIILIIIIIIIQIIIPAPDNESAFYILQKYINYIYSLITNFFINTENFLGTIRGIPKYNYNAPVFDTLYEKYFINKYNKYNPSVPIEKIKKLYKFIESLVSLDTDHYFLTPNDPQPNVFSENEKNKLSSIILAKLNLNNELKFSNFKFIKEPNYYLNFNGKDVEPFIFSVDCDDSNINNLLFYIQLAIRYDIKINTQYVVINVIKIIMDNNIVTNNSHITDSYKSPSYIKFNYTVPEYEKPNGQPDFNSIEGPVANDNLNENSYLNKESIIKYNFSSNE